MSFLLSSMSQNWKSLNLKDIEEIIPTNFFGRQDFIDFYLSVNGGVFNIVAFKSINNAQMEAQTKQKRPCGRFLIQSPKLIRSCFYQTLRCQGLAQACVLAILLAHQEWRYQHCLRRFHAVQVL